MWNYSIRKVRRHTDWQSVHSQHDDRVTTRGQWRTVNKRSCLINSDWARLRERHWKTHQIEGERKTKTEGEGQIERQRQKRSEIKIKNYYGLQKEIQQCWDNVYVSSRWTKHIICTLWQQLSSWGGTKGQWPFPTGNIQDKYVQILLKRSIHARHQDLMTLKVCN